MIAGVGADGAVTIAGRFNGPPDSGNGGYACGTLAGDGPAEVTLRRPIPLRTPLAIKRLRDGAAALADPAGEIVLQARALEGDEAAELEALAGEVPAVTLDVARAAGAATPLAHRHPFATCFGCGPDHESGLHCLAGPVPDAGEDVWAVTTTLESDEPQFVWAALDCPSAAPHMARAPGVPHVLGRMSAVVLSPPPVDTELAVVAWPTGSEGRRRFSVSALVDAGGRPLAVARATWVTLPLPASAAEG